MSGPLQGIGRRGTVLILFACVYIVFGFAMAGVVPSRPGMELVTDHVPLKTLGFFWIVSGVAGISLAAPAKSWMGYAALTPMPLLWAVTNAASYVLWVVGSVFHTDIPGAASTAWAGALVWTLVIGVLVIIAGWPEAPPPISDRGAE